LELLEGRRLTKGSFARSLVRDGDVNASVAELCVSEFADYCAIYLRSNGPLPAAFASRNAECFDALPELPRNDEYADRVRAAGIAKLLEEPIVFDGRVVGSLVLGFTSKRRIPKSARTSIAILRELLAKAGHQAEQLATQSRVSKRLQQAMLPPNLVELEGLLADAAYRPASAEADVGGDWYDAFESVNGKICISIGDVVGHGLEAAVTMAEIRGAIRATATATDSPALLLRRVDDLVSSQIAALATAIVGFYDPQSGILRYACAGHPAPAVQAPTGNVAFLPAGGLMLGLGSGARDEMTVTLMPGSTLFLYTDGLLGRDVVRGEEALLRALERLSVTERHAQALDLALFDGRPPSSDDCAILSIHRVAAGDEAAHLAYSSIPPCASLAREAVRHFSSRITQQDDRRYEVLSAVGEAIANAIEHGKTGADFVFELSVHADENDFIVEVSNPGHWRPFEPSIERGRGLQIMRTYANNLEVYSSQDSTRVTLTFNISR
jgi:serine phosphatase RsbU (regulator of sigma subunit)/anti-sigma regulatory factor (Ser/Thr protein kinase)